MHPNSSAETCSTSTASARVQQTPPPKRISSKRVQRLGYLLFDGQTSTVPCSVRDFTEDGATLAASGWMGLPEQFVLFVEPDSVRVTCEVVKRRGSKVQVVFSNWQEGKRVRASSL